MENKMNHEEMLFQIVKLIKSFKLNSNKANAHLLADVISFLAFKGGTEANEEVLENEK